MSVMPSLFLWVALIWLILVQQCCALKQHRNLLRGQNRQLADSVSTSIETAASQMLESGMELSETRDSIYPGVPLEPGVLKDSGKIANIVNGDDAGPDDAPYFVMMLSWSDVNEQWEFSGCGGTLITESHILTAGHCAVVGNPDRDAVYIHAYQPFMGNPGVPFHVSRVSEYKVHPDFDNDSNDNDVAIVSIELPVNLTEFPPVRLAEPGFELFDNEFIRVYGFGRTVAEERSMVPTLQYAEMPFVSRNACQEYYGSQVLDDMFCAGYKDGGTDSCNGDSGGPMVANTMNQTYQYGIVSWGHVCGAANSPGVYTSIPYHYPWIQETTCGALVGSKSPLCETYESGHLNLPTVTLSNNSIPLSTCEKRNIGESCWYDRHCCSGLCQVGEGNQSWQRVCSRNYST